MGDIYISLEKINLALEAYSNASHLLNATDKFSFELLQSVQAKIQKIELTSMFPSIALFVSYHLLVGSMCELETKSLEELGIMLGVKDRTNCKKTDIRNAFRKLSKQYHPDKLEPTTTTCATTNYNILLKAREYFVQLCY